MDLSQVLTALRNADAAGDKEAATRLAQIAQQMQAQPVEAPAPAKKSTIGSELLRGAKQLGSGYVTGIEALGDAEAAGIAGLQRQKEIAEAAGEGVSWDAVKKAYEDKGILSATGEFIGQVPRAVAGQAANIGAMAGGARLGAMAGSAIMPGVGTVIGGALGAGAALLPQFFGSNVERQVQAAQEAGKEIKVDRTSALGAAVAQAGMEGVGGAFAVGKRALGTILGKDLIKAGGAKAEQELLAAANRSVAGTLGRGAVRGAAAEMPVELAQQVLERAQAGLSLTDKDAMSEYGDTLYQTALMAGPIGSAGSVYTRAGAKKEIAAQQAEKDQLALAERQRLAEEEKAAKQAEFEARAAEPTYIPNLIDQYNIGQQQLNDLKKQSKDRTLNEEQRDALRVQFEEARDKFKELQAEYAANKDRITEYQGSQGFFDQLVGQRDALDAQIAQLKEQSKTPGIDETAKKALLKQVADLTRQRGKVEKDLVARPEQLAAYDQAKRAAAPKPLTFQELRAQEQALSTQLKEATATGDTAAIAQAAEQYKGTLAELNKHPQTQYEETMAKFEAEQAKEKPNDKAIASLAMRIEALKKKGADETIYRDRLAIEQAERDAVAKATADEEIAAFQQKAADVAARAKNVEQLAQQQEDLLAMQKQPEPSLGQLGIEGYQASQASLEKPYVAPGTAEDLAAYQAGLGLPAPKEMGPFQPEQKRGSTTRILPPGLASLEAERQATEARSEKRVDALLGALSSQESDFVKTEPDMQPQQHKFRAKEAGMAVSNAELTFNEALGNVESGTYLGGKNAAAGSSTEQGLRNQAEDAQAAYLDSALKYVEHERAARGLAPLKIDQALNFAYDVRDTLRAAIRAGKPDEKAFEVLRGGINDMLKREGIVRRRNVQLGLFGSVEQRVSKLKSEQYGEPEDKATYSELVKEKEVLQRAVAGLEKTMAEHKEAGRVPKYSKRYEIDANSLKQYKQALAEIDARIAAAEKGGVAKKELARSPEQIEKDREVDFVVERLRDAEEKATDKDAAVLKDARRLLIDGKGTPALMQEANSQAARVLREQDANTSKLSELVLEAKQAQAGEGPVGVKETPVYAVAGEGTAKGMQALRGVTERGEQIGVEKGKTKYTKGVQQELPGVDATRTERVGPQQFARYMVSHERELWRMNWETERKNLVAQLKVMAGNFKRAANQAAAQTAKMEAEAKQAEITLNKAFTGVSASLRDGVLKFETRLEDLLKTNIEKSTPLLIEKQVDEAKAEYNKFVMRAQPLVNKLTKTFHYSDNATALKAKNLLERIYAKQEMLAERVEVAAQGLYDGQLQRIHRSTVLSKVVQNEAARLAELEKKLAATKKPATEYQQRMKEQRAVLGAAEARIAEAKQKATDDARKAHQAMLEARDQTTRVHYTVESVMVQSPDRKGGEPIMSYAVTETGADKAKRADLNEDIAAAREAKERAIVAGNQSEVNRQDRKIKQLLLERANLGEAVRERVARTPEPMSDKALEKAAEETAGAGKYGRKQLTAKQRAAIKEEVSPTIGQLKAGEASLIKEPVTKYTIKAAQKTKPTSAARVTKTAETAVESARVANLQKEIRREINKELLEKGELATFSPREIAQQIRELTEVINDTENSTREEIKKAREEKALLLGVLKSNKALEVLGEGSGKREIVAELRTGTPKSLKTLAEIDENFDEEARIAAKTAVFRDADVAPPTKPVNASEASAHVGRVQDKMAKNGIKFVYADTTMDAPVAYKEALRVQGVAFAKGAVLADGTVVVIGDMHSSLKDLEETIAHEVVGHYGVEGALGKEGLASLTKLIFSKPGQINQIADALGVLEDVLGAEQAGKGMNLTQPEIQELMVRELIAHTAEAKAKSVGAVDTVKNWIKTLVNAVRTWFKKLGMDDVARATTSDIQKLVNQSFKQYTHNELPAYRSPNGKVAFRMGQPAYATGYSPTAIELEQRLIGRQKGLIDEVRATANGMVFATKYVDSRAGLEYLARGMQKSHIQHELMGMQTMYWARTFDARSLSVAQAASSGPQMIKKQMRKDGQEEYVLASSGAPSLKDIVKRVGEASKGIGDANTTLRQFGLYLIAKRATRLGVEKALGFDLSAAEEAKYKQQFKEILALHKDNAAFQDAASMYAEYNKALMNLLAQSGYISQETANALTKHGDYVGFYRQGDKLMDGEGTVTIGDISKQKYLQELVGGGQQIVDFQTSALQNTSLIMDLALRNLATRNTAFMLESLGYAKIRDNVGPASANIVRFKRHGKDVHAVVDTDASGLPTEVLMKGLEGVATTLPAGIKLLQGPANLLRKWVTRMPMYVVRQVMRDSMAAAIVSGSDAMPITTATKQLYSIYKGTNQVERGLQEKGFLGGQQFTGDMAQDKKLIESIASGKVGFARMMDKLDRLAMAADASARVTAYNSYIAQGMSDMEASLAALEIMNFTKRGVSPTARYAAMLIPFFNAQVQGLNVLAKSFRGTNLFEKKLNMRKKMLERGSILMGMTLLYAMAMQDDEAYKNATIEERMNNWFVRLPGLDEPLRVPIPFEIGTVFKAIPELLFNLAASDTQLKDALPAVGNTIRNTLPGGSNWGVPQAMKPLIEIGTNHSFFTGKEIEGQRFAGIEPGMRYNKSTTELAKALGATLGISPIKIDYLVRGYMGSAGILMMSAMDPFMEDAGPVDRKLSEMPFIGGAFQPNEGRGYINSAYDTAERIQQARGTYKKLIEEGKPAEAMAYARENAKLLSMASFAGSFKQRMGELAAAQRRIEAMPESEMSSTRKRELLEQIRTAQITLSKQLRLGE